MTNVHELLDFKIRNDADLKKFVKNHAGASPRAMVKAINISIELATGADGTAHNHRLNAGRMLLELRERVEADGGNFWKWQDGMFNRSRKDLEKLMRLARADDPEAAISEYREKDAQAHRKARKNGADVCSVQTPQDVIKIVRLWTDEQRAEFIGLLKEEGLW